MALVETEPASPKLIAQVTRFVAVGLLSAVVDFGSYQALLATGTWTDLAKGISFVLGTVTAYLLNRRWTFGSAGGTAPALRFTLLYTVTFFVNVSVNALVLHELTGHRFGVPIAWVIAQGVTTAINFVLLRAFVFRDRPDSPELDVLDTLEHAITEHINPHHRTEAAAFDGLTED